MTSLSSVRRLRQCLKTSVAVAVGVIGVTLRSASADAVAYEPFFGETDETYTATADGRPVTIAGGWKGVYIGRFAISGECEIAITGPDAHIAGYSVMPHRLGIRGTIDGNTLRFTLESPANMRIQINENHPVHLFAYSALSASDTSGADIKNAVDDFGVDNTGGGNATAGLQGAIDELSSQGGGVLFLPAGTYSGSAESSIYVKSDVSLLLSPHALVKQIRCLINDATNVKILGHGVFDFTGAPSGNQESYLRTNRVKTLEIRDIVSINTDYNWNTRTSHTEDVTIENYKVISGKDGIDPVDSKNIRIRNVHVLSIDDCIAIKSFRPGVASSHDITVEDCFLDCFKYGGIKIGTETNAGAFARITFRNIEILAAERASIIQLRDGAAISDIVIENVDVFRAWKHSIAFLIEERYGLGTIDGVEVRDYRVLNSAGGMMTGYDDAHAITNVAYTDLYLDGQLVTESNQTGFDFAFTRDITFEPGASVDKRISELSSYVTAKSALWESSGDKPFENLFDGDITTTGRSPGTDDAWIELDLGEHRAISGIQVRRARDGITGYSLAVADGGSWNTIVDHALCWEDYKLYETLLPGDVEARKVRVTIHPQVGGSRAELAELYLLERVGQQPTGAPPTPLVRRAGARPRPALATEIVPLCEKNDGTLLDLRGRLIVRPTAKRSVGRARGVSIVIPPQGGRD